LILIRLRNNVKNLAGELECRLYYLVYRLTRSNPIPSSGATRVSRIGSKISEALQKSDWMMTFPMIRPSIFIAMVTRLQTYLQMYRLTPETCLAPKHRPFLHDLPIRLSLLSCAGRSGRPVLNAPMPPPRQEALLITASSLPIA
jgi:hypothetical protein